MDKLTLIDYSIRINFLHKKKWRCDSSLRIDDFSLRPCCIRHCVYYFWHRRQIPYQISFNDAFQRELCLSFSTLCVSVSAPNILIHQVFCTVSYHSCLPNLCHSLTNIANSVGIRITSKGINLYFILELMHEEAVKFDFFTKMLQQGKILWREIKSFKLLNAKWIGYWNTFNEYLLTSYHWTTLRKKDTEIITNFNVIKYTKNANEVMQKLKLLKHTKQIILKRVIFYFIFFFSQNFEGHG